MSTRLASPEPEAGGAIAAIAAVTANPLFSQQWYLNNTGQTGGTPGADINVLPAWAENFTGQGVTIVDDDTGIDYTNANIAPNYDATTSQSLDALTNSGYPYNTDFLTGSAVQDLAHGTWTAGLMAAANNGTGIVGVAYNATISSFRLLDTLADQDNPWGSTAAALLNTENFDVANNSWTFTAPLADSVFSPQASTALSALLTAATNGRNGLGTINVFAAGNYYQEGDDTNLHAFQSSINVVTVAAVDDNGTVNAPGGRYSTPGASILVSAPGTGIISDTIVGWGNAGGGNAESGLNGTSFATPLVSGVIALMLQANPNLGLRDVQQILAYTAVQTDPGDATWHVNAASNWNGGGLLVSNDYGFGMVDAAAAVALAQSWTTQDTVANRTIDTVNDQSLIGLVPYSTTIHFTVTSSDALTLNWVRVQLSLDFYNFANMKIVLTSPDGTSSVLLNQPNDGLGAAFFSNSLQLSSDQFWGEHTVGNWTLWVGGANPGLASSNDVFSASLVLVGDPVSANNTYIYTNSYPTEAAQDAARATLNDTGGGNDTLNVAAVSGSCVLNIAAGGVCTIDGTPLTIGADTRITSVMTGYGAATVYVNGLADTISNDGGQDSVVFPDALPDYTVQRTGSAQITVSRGGISDTLNNVQTLQFADRTLTLGSGESLLITGTAAGQRVSDDGTIAPLANVTIVDLVPGATDTASVTLSAATGGTLSNLGAGSYNAGTGVYTVSGSAAAVTAALDGLVFTPAAEPPGQSNTTTFAVQDLSTSGAGASDATTSVIATNTRVVLHAAASEYEIADDNGALLVNDVGSGGDGSQTLPGVTELIFTDGIGVFDPTGSAEQIARLYGVALGRAPDVAGLEYWTGLMDNANVPLATVASAFTTSPEFINNYGTPSDSAFLRLLYQNALGRAPDAAGLTYWEGLLSNGVSRGAVLVGFAESQEYEADTVTLSSGNTLFAAGDQANGEIYRLYQAALMRAPDPSGQAYWASYLQAGASLTDIAAGFVNSAEFQADYGSITPSQFVKLLYNNVLHRAPDSAGLNYWVGALSAGSSEEAVLLGFSDSSEFRADTASATHANWIFIPS